MMAESAPVLSPRGQSMLLKSTRAVQNYKEGEFHMGNHYNEQIDEEVYNLGHYVGSRPMSTVQNHPAEASHLTKNYK